MMPEDLFEAPADSPQQVAFDKKVDEINEGVRIVVQAAFNFDTCHTFTDLFFFAQEHFEDVGEYSNEKVGSYSMIYCDGKDTQTPSYLNRNFHESTQRIFGFAHDNQPQFKNIKQGCETIELNLTSSSTSGPAIASGFLKGYKIKMCFWPVSNYDGQATIWDRLDNAKLVLNTETLEDLIRIKTSVDQTIKDIREIEVRCHLGGCFKGYLGYLEDWDDEQAKSNQQSTLES